MLLYAIGFLVVFLGVAIYALITGDSSWFEDHYDNSPAYVTLSSEDIASGASWEIAGVTDDRGRARLPAVRVDPFNYQAVLAVGCGGQLTIVAVQLDAPVQINGTVPINLQWDDGLSYRERWDSEIQSSVEVEGTELYRTLVHPSSRTSIDAMLLVLVAGEKLVIELDTREFGGEVVRAQFAIKGAGDVVEHLDRYCNP